MKFDKIYFDMDGVLADFNRGVKELAGFEQQDQENATKEQDDLMWQAVAKVPHFYDKLELMPDAKELFDYIYEKYGDKVEILSAIPKPKRGILTAGEDKIAWMHRVLAPDIKVNIVMREEKKNYCISPYCLLIDDLVPNLEAWCEYGGVGILNVTSKKSLEEFKRMERIPRFSSSDANPCGCVLERK